MGGIGGIVGGLTDAIGLTDIEGQQDAAEDAVWAQQQSGEKSIDFQRESRDIALGNLNPFVNFATGNVSPYSGPGGFLESVSAPLQSTATKSKWGQIVSAYNAKNAPKTQQFIPGSATNPGPGYTSSSPMGMYSALLDPANQASYLLSNPMFMASLDNLNRGTRNQGYMSGLKGDMLSQLQQNWLVSGQQYINNERNALLQPIQIGQASAAGQANTALTSGANIGNTMTGIGNAQAAGIIGAGNAQANAMSGLLQAGAMLGGAAMSDRRLKRDIKQLYADEIGGVYEFRYIDGDQKFIGRMADEIQKSRPDAVFVGDDGFMRVTAEFAPRAI